MFNDPISDMLTRIRNALRVRKPEVQMPFSVVKWHIAKILKDASYIEGFEKIGNSEKQTSPEKQNRSSFDEILIRLKYNQEGVPAMEQLKRVSTPGRRVYVKKQHLPVVLNNLGICIISTPQGIMTTKEAKKLGLGGEVLCEIY